MKYRKGVGVAFSVIYWGAFMTNACEAEQVSSPNGNGFEGFKPIPKEKVIETGKVLMEFSYLGGLTSWTKVPKGSIIHVPEFHKASVGKQKGKLVSWEEFYRKNRGIIHLHKVTMAQARGLEKIDPKIIEAYQASGRIVVAVHRNSIISVMEEAYTPTQQENLTK